MLRHLLRHLLLFIVVILRKNIQDLRQSLHISRSLSVFFRSLGHLVTLSLGYSVTRSLLQLFTYSFKLFLDFLVVLDCWHCHNILRKTCNITLCYEVTSTLCNICGNLVYVCLVYKCFRVDGSSLAAILLFGPLSNVYDCWCTTVLEFMGNMQCGITIYLFLK